MDTKMNFLTPSCQILWLSLLINFLKINSSTKNNKIISSSLVLSFRAVLMAICYKNLIDTQGHWKLLVFDFLRFWKFSPNFWLIENPYNSFISWWNFLFFGSNERFGSWANHLEVEILNFELWEQQEVRKWPNFHFRSHF